MKLDIPVRVKKGHIEQFPRCRVDGAVQVDEKWYVSCYRIGEYPDEMKSGKHRFPLLEVDFKKKDYASNNMGTLSYLLPSLCRGKNDGEISLADRGIDEQ